MAITAEIARYSGGCRVPKKVQRRGPDQHFDGMIEQRPIPVLLANDYNIDIEQATAGHGEQIRQISGNAA
jgi:hypothetical protein